MFLDDLKLQVNRLAEQGRLEFTDEAKINATLCLCECIQALHAMLDEKLSILCSCINDDGELNFNRGRIA